MQALMQLVDLELKFSHKLCFEGFSYSVYPGEKIALIGDNGSGKSTLMKMMAGVEPATEGKILCDLSTCISYVPQFLVEDKELSGGQRFIKALSLALARDPDILLLDEPTNHLDLANRTSLLKRLNHLPAAQIIISHDHTLLEEWADTIWHIHNSHVKVFKGAYANYRRDLEESRRKLYEKISRLKDEKNKLHESLMREQVRAKNSRKQGEKNIEGRKWPTITSGAKARRAETTSGKKRLELNQARSEVIDELSALWQPEELKYSFTLQCNEQLKSLITIIRGSCSYSSGKTVLNNIAFNLYGGERVALVGANGCGKSTLVKAIMQDGQIVTRGEWYMPGKNDVAYLDQHYSNLPTEGSVMKMIQGLRPGWSYAECRNFLNQFLFRKNEEVANLVTNLSGGEKVRLSLAQIALRAPRLLILDEVTNNIDMLARSYIEQILRSYTGGLLVISHDINFLEAIAIREQINVEDFNISF